MSQDNVNNPNNPNIPDNPDSPDNPDNPNNEPDMYERMGITRGIISVNFKKDIPVERMLEILTAIAGEEGVIRSERTCPEYPNLGHRATVQVNHKDRTDPVIALIKQYEEVSSAEEMLPQICFPGFTSLE